MLGILSDCQTLPQRPERLPGLQGDWVLAGLPVLLSREISAFVAADLLILRLAPTWARSEKRENTVCAVRTHVSFVLCHASYLLFFLRYRRSSQLLDRSLNFKRRSQRLTSTQEMGASLSNQSLSQKAPRELRECV